MATMGMLAVYLALICVSGVLCQNESDVKAQIDDENAITKAFEKFLNNLESSSLEVGFYKDSIRDVFPSIQALQRVFSFARANFKDENQVLEPAKEAFRAMITQINQLEIALSSFLGDDAPSTNATIMKWYKDQRASISAVEENVRLLAHATTLKEKKHFSKGLEEECQRNNPGRFFLEHPRARSIDRNQALAILSDGHDRSKLIKWVKLITGDAVRALSMYQACAGSSGSSTTEDLESAWAKVNDIFDDLKREADRVTRHLEEQRSNELKSELQEEIKAQLANVDPNGDMVQSTNTISAALSAKYPTRYFGVFIFGGQFEKQIFDQQRAIEIPFGKKTLLVIWVEGAQRKKESYDKIKAYLDTIPCVPEAQYASFRQESIKQVSERLSQLGAITVYVTDGNYASRVYHEVGFGVRSRCNASQTSPKPSTWQYTRSFIVGY